MESQKRFLNPQLSVARVTYTGGYVLPGAISAAGQTALPPGLEQASVEQVAFWFQTRSTAGANRIWPSGGNYTQYADIDLIPLPAPSSVATCVSCSNPTLPFQVYLLSTLGDKRPPAVKNGLYPLAYSLTMTRMRDAIGS